MKEATAIATKTTPRTYTKSKLPDFARRQWTSAAARKLWEPRITKIGAQFAAAERQSVELGIRRSALQNITPEQLPELSRLAARRGLVLTVLGTQGRPESYGASATPITGPWDYRVALSRRLEDAARFSDAWGPGNDDTIGDLLGYPDCCRRFFRETWAAGSIDPTWYMDGRIGNWTSDVPTPETHGAGPDQANILLRWLGVRAVPHMPCSFQCEATVELGDKLRQLISPLERGWLDELLAMPALWSARIGIGEVTTPIVKVNFRSDPAPELREIRRAGSRYPELGATGLRFPYQPPAARRGSVSISLGVKDEMSKKLEQLSTELGRAAGDAMARSDAAAAKEFDDLGALRRRPIDLGPGTPDVEWTDNGFGSADAMKQAHDLILSVRPPKEYEPAKTVLDLGAGNGRLARWLAGPEGTALGVEIDEKRAARANRYLNQISAGDMFEIFQSAGLGELDLVVLMPGRLLERRPGGEILIKKLRELERAELLVYAYGDWLEHGSLEELCQAAGLVGELAELRAGDGVAAGIWRWA